MAPIHYAAQKSTSSLVEALHEAGANLSLRMLVDEDEIFEEGFLDAAPLHFAAVHGSEAVIDYLLDHGVDINAEASLLEDVDYEEPMNLSAAMAALRYFQYSAAQQLLRRGGDVGYQDSYGATVLHYCFKGFHEDLCYYPNVSEATVLETMRLALDSGADLNAQSMHLLEDGNHRELTALHMAAYRNNVGILKFLIDAGADVNAKGEDCGCTPLHHATVMGSLDAFKALLEAGADIFAVTDQGESVLHKYERFEGPHANSAGRLKIFEIALAAGLDINAKTMDTAILDKEFTPLCICTERGWTAGVRFFIDHGADMNIREHSGYPPVHLSIVHRHKDILKLFIEAGVDLSTRSPEGTMPQAAASGRDYHLRYPQYTHILRTYEEMMGMLVAAGQRDWASIPTPCYGLEQALPAVMRDTPENLFHLFERLEPEIQGEIRAALLLLNRFCSRGSKDLQLPLLEALVDRHAKDY